MVCISASPALRHKRPSDYLELWAKVWEMAEVQPFLEAKALAESGEYEELSRALRRVKAEAATISRAVDGSAEGCAL